MTKSIPIPSPLDGFSYPDPLSCFLINDPTLIYPSSLPSPLSSSPSPHPIPPIDCNDSTTDCLFANLLGDLDPASFSKHSYTRSDMDIMNMIPDLFNLPPSNYQLPSPPAIDDIPPLEPGSPISPYPTINFDSIFPSSLPVSSSSSSVTSASPIIAFSTGPTITATTTTSHPIVTTPLSTYSLVSSTSILPLESPFISNSNEDNVNTITNHSSYLPTVLPPPTSPVSLPPVAHSAINSLQAYHQHRLKEAHAMVEAIKAAQVKPSGPPPGTVAAAVIPKLVTEKGIPTATTSIPNNNSNDINIIKSPTLRHLLTESNRPIDTKAKNNNNNNSISISMKSEPSCNGVNKRKLDIPDEVLPWPSHLVPMDAPIQKKRRVANTNIPNTTIPTNNNIILSPLINDNQISYTSSITINNDDTDRPASPETAKRIKNTLSARRSRARRAAKMDYLESRVMDLELEVSSLRKLLTDNGIPIPPSLSLV